MRRGDRSRSLVLQDQIATNSIVARPHPQHIAEVEISTGWPKSGHFDATLGLCNSSVSYNRRSGGTEVRLPLILTSGKRYVLAEFSWV